MATAARPPELVGYDEDFALWLEQQARAVESGRWPEVDRENVAEELRGLAKRDFREFFSLLAVVIQHMLKWDWQPKLRSGSWRQSISSHRSDAELVAEDNPSFAARRAEAIARHLGLAPGRTYATSSSPFTAAS